MTEKSYMVYNTAEVNTHVQCSRASRLREIIGNQVRNLSDPVTVSEESAANAIAKARRCGGRRRASQETCRVWCGWVSSAERILSGARPCQILVEALFWRVWVGLALF